MEHPTNTCPKGYRKHLKSSLIPETCNFIEINYDNRNNTQQNSLHKYAVLNKNLSTLIIIHKSIRFKQYKKDNLS